MIEGIRGWINSIKNTIGIKGAINSLIFMIIVLIFSIIFTDNAPIRFVEGQTAKEDIRALQETEDTRATQERIEAIVSEIDPVYRVSPTIGIIAKDKVTDYFSLIRDVKFNNQTSLDDKVDTLLKEASIILEEEPTRAILSLEFRDINYLESIIVDITNQLLSQGIKDEDLELIITSLDESVATLNLEEVSHNLVVSILKEVIQENEFIDIIATERRINEAKESVPKTIILPGDVVIREGESFTEYKIELLNAAGVFEESTARFLWYYVGLSIILMGSFILLFAYLFKFNKQTFKGNRIYLLYSILLIGIVFNYVVSIFSIYLMPLSLSGILISMLFNPLVGILSSVFLVTTLLLITSMPLGLGIIGLLGMSIVFFYLESTHQRIQLLLKGLYIGVVKAVLTLSLIGFGASISTDIIVDSLLLVSSGVISGIISLGSLPIWENLFKILTPLKLMELSNPNEPLLKRLQLEAPGTYQHSLMVGNLSEAAAEKIGANALLAKVASYYHDIGKLKRPIYFKENQMNMENPHDSLETLQSLEVIISHREDGIKLGREYKLHNDIIDIVDQHHGTTLMTYFFHQATEKGIELPESKFRYQGVKPQTKEAAIVMLSDSVEAAVRSIKDIDEDKIYAMVTNIIKGKVDDGQLDESNITLNELKAIKEEYINVLKRIYHGRIEYPKLERN